LFNAAPRFKNCPFSCPEKGWPDFPLKVAALE
jgi:transcription initiation factor IIF auxiliary subunit